MRKNKKLILMLLIIVIVLVIMTIVVISIAVKDSLKEETEDKAYSVVVCEVREKENIWEVKVEYPAGHKILYKNGVEQEILQSLTTTGAKECLKLPTTDNVGKDIEARGTDQIITWSAKLTESAEYINLLKHNGYTEIRYASTPDYIEVFLQKDATIKRVLILKESIMIADTIIEQLPDIKYYYQ